MRDQVYLTGGFSSLRVAESFWCEKGESLLCPYSSPFSCTSRDPVHQPLRPGLESPCEQLDRRAGGAV